MSLVGQSYKVTLSRDANGVPNGASAVPVNFIAGVFQRALNVDDNVVYTGLANTAGRIADAAIGAEIQIYRDTGSMRLPFTRAN